MNSEVDELFVDRSLHISGGGTGSDCHPFPCTSQHFGARRGILLHAGQVWLCTYCAGLGHPWGSRGRGKGGEHGPFA